MRKEKSLGLKEARKIADAIIYASEKSEGLPMAAAAVNRHGDLVYFERMDGATPITARMAVTKCYSEMELLRDTIASREVQEKLDLKSYEFSSTTYTTIPGGVLIKTKDGNVVSAVGTSGRTPLVAMGDEELALIGAKAFEEF